MDYDDNDFQSQNLQLAGESSNKFPPVLRPYALPKFDFDDNLHGSLRFDSLVETEVFLGIESNEDSQWIEDFSRGSGGIQFSSSAAESCSIPLRNNVWSEATSSESVEMLLKSVGQEELILAQNHSKESDACDELGCIIKQMEPNLKQNSNIATRVEDFKDLQPSLLPVHFPGNARLDDSDHGQQSHIEDISQSGGDTSADQGLGDLTAISVDARLPIAGRGQFIDKCDSINEMQVDNAANESSDNRIQESSASGTEVDNVVATEQNIIQGNDVMENKDAPDHVIETADGESGADKCQHHEKGDFIEGVQLHVHVPNAENPGSSPSRLDDPLSLSAVETIEDKSKIEPNLCSMGEPDVIPQEDFAIDTFHQSPVDTVEASLVVTKVDSIDERDQAEDFNGAHLDKDLVTNTVPSPLSVEDNKSSEGKVDGKFISSGAVNHSSSEVGGEINVEGHVPSSMMVENIQTCDKDVSESHDVIDVAIEHKKSVELPSIDRDIDGINYENVSASPFAEGSRGEPVVSKPESDSTAGDESANGVSVPPENDINKVIACEGKVEASPFSTVFTCSNTEKKPAAESSAEASITDLKIASEATPGADSVSDPKERSAAVAEQMVDESPDQLALDADAKNQIESHSVITENVSEECIKDSDAMLPASESSAEKRESIEEQITGKRNYENQKEHVNVSDPAVDVEIRGPVPSVTMDSLLDTSHKVQEEVVMPSEDLKVGQIAVPSTNVELEGSPVLDKPASESPTIIRSSQSSYDERNNEGVKTLSNQSGLVSADKLQSASPYPNKTDPPKDDGSFSFEVTPVAEKPRKNSRKRHASSSVEASSGSAIVDASTPSGLGQLGPKVALHLSHGSPKVSDAADVLSGSKGNTERKPRRASSKATPKDTAKKRNSAKETASAKLDRGNKMTGVSSSSSGASQLMQSNEIQRFGNLDSNSLKPFVLAASTAGLPDLNSSVSPAAVFHQPFSDLQQVQLRAQIFVYGALIQGTAPDEAYMISAFGGPDGGRNFWENSWRSCIERHHGHKSHLMTPETPIQSRSGARAPEQSIKHGALQSKVVSSPIGRGSSKGTPAIASPIVPFSSPLWTLPTPSDTLQPSNMPRGSVVDYQRPLSPLHPHQTPGIRNFIGHNPSWLSQAPYGTPWGGSPQNSTLDTSGRFSVQFPISETVQPTPVKETSLHHSSATKPTCPPAQSTASSTVFAGNSSMLNSKMATASGSQPASAPKPRKRRKNSFSDNAAQNILPSQPQTDSVIASVVASSISTPVAFATPVGFVSKAPAEKLITSTFPLPADLSKGEQISEQKAILSDETLGKVEDAKIQAEDAAASAASAVSHSQQVWDQLEKQKNAGLLPDAESKLASAAVAIAAAAAVAKAAAAAAKVASNAALQAKLMAEEAVTSGNHTNISQTSAISFHDGMKNFSKATPASILKGDDGTTYSPSSFLVAAREATRKRVEAASAASKQAENMDAIVKAAELAAQAVSQAGQIVAMGDPMPLSELVAAGPEGYWKAATPEMTWKSNDTDRENRNVNSGIEGPDTSMRQSKEVSPEKKENHIATHGKPPAPIERYSEDQERPVEGLPGSDVIIMKEAKLQKGRKTSDLAKVIGVVPESGNGSRSSIVPNEPENEETSKENNMKEHSVVEVYKDGNGFKAAWYPARVMSFKDGKAFVEYTELALGDGSEKLKEWVPHEGNEGEAPKVRIARPTTAMQFEGTRKRRRSAMVDHVWSLGDRVDAWIEDSWREGVVTEKNKIDESLLTVTFPARGEKLVLPASQLHPSRIWKDGKWVDWPSSGEKNRPSHGGDTPKEKRPRVRSPVVEARGKDKSSKSVDAVESDKSEDPTLLALSTDEKVFNLGKSTDTTRMPRTGLQKEGSRVVFGVPKPGKKRKFMDVSKHYVGDRSGQMSESNDSLKFTKYLMPQGPSSRSWKSSKPETNEKRAAVRPKVLRSGKPPSVSGRTIPHKDNLSNAAASVSKESVNQTENTLEQKNTSGFQSYSSSGKAPENPAVFSARTPQTSGVPFKRMHAKDAKPERVSKGRLAPASSRLEKIEEGKTPNGNSSARSTSDSTEPRRSNRRIQPTSRLLEGLQSSLMISKIPSVSHDKSHKSRNTSSSRGNNQG
ncbi:G2484-1 protein [Euphorbia peplus]|nr:G2484-1 protein [Euphorbia peplus]